VSLKCALVTIICREILRARKKCKSGTIRFHADKEVSRCQNRFRMTGTGLICRLSIFGRTKRLWWTEIKHFWNAIHSLDTGIVENCSEENICKITSLPETIEHQCLLLLSAREIGAIRSEPLGTRGQDGAIALVNPK
jgi:hypothetical protein